MTPVDLDTIVFDVLRDALRIAFVIAIGKLLIHLITTAVLTSIAIAKGTDGYKERAQTIQNVIRLVGNVITYSIALFLLLTALGIDIRPLLAGAGVLGLIAGLGAQTLMKDFFTGIVISAEDQYRVGERIKINSGIEGTVVEIALRLTTLRGTDGELHHILNSAITTVTNYSRKK